MRLLSRWKLNRAAAAGALCATLAATGFVAFPAMASPAPDSVFPSPQSVEGRPGAVVGTAPASHLAGIIDKNAARASTFRYLSTQQDGTPTEVTGTLFEPTAPWLGPGPTPTIAFGPGTRGEGDQCAPSVADEQVLGVDTVHGSLNVNYEYPFFQAAVAAGVRVVVTDYIGLGTPGPHTYVNHIEEGHALIDAARAALTMSGAGPDSPVGFAGYSQGGGAAAAAAEMAADYAPELTVAGTYAGGPPANLPDVIGAVDGSSIMHVLGYALNGFMERGPAVADAINRTFNDRGQAFLADAHTSCIGESILKWGFTPSRELTKDGRSFTEIVAAEPALRDALAEQQLGRRPLNAPLLVANSPSDDIIPFAQSRQLAVDQCTAGGTVEFQALPATKFLPRSGAAHVAGMFGSYPAGLAYLIDRFTGVAAPTNCGEF